MDDLIGSNSLPKLSMLAVKGCPLSSKPGDSWDCLVGLYFMLLQPLSVLSNSEHSWMIYWLAFEMDNFSFWRHVWCGWAGCQPCVSRSISYRLAFWDVERNPSMVYNALQAWKCWCVIKKQLGEIGFWVSGWGLQGRWLSFFLFWSISGISPTVCLSGLVNTECDVFAALFAPVGLVVAVIA